MQIDKFTLIENLTYGLRNQLIEATEASANKPIVVNNKILEIGIMSVDGKTDKKEIMEIVDNTDIEIVDKLLEYMIGLMGKKKNLTSQE